MYVKNVDGKPVFATHLINCNAKEQSLPFQHESEGIVCYSQEECDIAVNKIKILNIQYSIQELDHTIEKQQIDPDCIYHSRTEIVEHIKNGKIPNHKKQMDLEREVITLRKIIDKLLNNFKQ